MPAKIKVRPISEEDRKRLPTEMPVCNRLRARAEAERAPRARREKLLCLGLMLGAAVLLAHRIYYWALSEEGFTSVAVMAWPNTAVFGGLFLVFGYLAVCSFRIGRRWKAAAVIFAAVFALVAGEIV